MYNLCSIVISRFVSRIGKFQNSVSLAATQELSVMGIPPRVVIVVVVSHGLVDRGMTSYPKGGATINEKRKGGRRKTLESMRSNAQENQSSGG